MLKLNKTLIDDKRILNELLVGSGVVLIKEVFQIDKINEALEIVNKFADSDEQKESHFNAEAESSGKIHLQQRVWNLFGKGDIFSNLITDDIIFNIMSQLLGSEFVCGSYCASRLLPGSPGQELHIDYPYWDYYKSETFPLGLNSSFAQNCQVTIPLDICSEVSGATTYIPGSQKNLHYPTQNDDFSDKQQNTLHNTLPCPPRRFGSHMATHSTRLLPWHFSTYLVGFHPWLVSLPVPLRDQVHAL